jgi:simple sugar transport system ATP-binding protein
LSVGAQQRLEILKAVSRRARILILDEPTAVLAPAEARELLAWLRAFSESGNSVILITHKLEEALAVADDVSVLRYGRTVLASPASQTSATALANAMLGAAPAEAPSAPPSETGDIVLRLAAVSLTDADGRLRMEDVNLEVREHEILGIAALENSGHELLLRAIANRAKPASGIIERRGAVALIPEDRQRDALILGFSLTENLALKGAGARRGRLNWQELRGAASALTRAYDVRTTGPDIPAGQLSGGNQQKWVLARELSSGPAIVVAVNPTRGLDIRATADVHGRLREAAARGAVVILYSSDLDEVLSLATRVVAVHAGRLRRVPNEREAVGRAMLGLT